MSTDHLAPWLSEDAAHWFARAETWIAEAHESLGIGPLESVERIKVRPWSVVLRANSRRPFPKRSAEYSGDHFATPISSRGPVWHRSSLFGLIFAVHFGLRMSYASWTGSKCSMERTMLRSRAGCRTSVKNYRDGSRGFHT